MIVVLYMSEPRGESGLVMIVNHNDSGSDGLAGCPLFFDKCIGDEVFYSFRPGGVTVLIDMLVKSIEQSFIKRYCEPSYFGHAETI